MSSSSNINIVCEDVSQNLKHILTEARSIAQAVSRLTSAALCYNPDDFSEEVFGLRERAPEGPESVTGLFGYELEGLSQ